MHASLVGTEGRVGISQFCQERSWEAAEGMKVQSIDAKESYLYSNAQVSVAQTLEIISN